MIKTKSILAEKNKDGGTRICIMRYVKPFYKYDEWLVDLAPSRYLLNLYMYKGLPWKVYETMYKQEMKSNKFKIVLIRNLKQRSDKGETITLLCWEKDDTYCHRRLLKELINNVKI